jgi:hypothetical protein
LRRQPAGDPHPPAGRPCPEEPTSKRSPSSYNPRARLRPNSAGPPEIERRVCVIFLELPRGARQAVQRAAAPLLQAASEARLSAGGGVSRRWPTSRRASNSRSGATPRAPSRGSPGGGHQPRTACLIRPLTRGSAEPVYVDRPDPNGRSRSKGFRPERGRRASWPTCSASSGSCRAS